jgi:protein-tyrosine phosphatase
LASQANVSASFASDGGYADIAAARNSVYARQNLARYGWPDSLSLALRYSTGIQALREMVAYKSGADLLPARFTEPPSRGLTSVRRQVGRLVRGGIRRHQDAAVVGAQGAAGFRAVQLDKVKRLVFVCAGNICRSPYAEAVARLRGWPTESYGLDVTRTDSADEEANKVALMLAVDMTRHQSRSISGVAFTESDCLVAMEPAQFVAIEELKMRYGCQVTLLGAWGRQPTHRVPDPFRKGRKEMERVLRMIEDSVSGLIDEIDRNKPQPRDAAVPHESGRAV